MKTILIITVILIVCLFEGLHQSIGDPKPSRYYYYDCLRSYGAITDMETVKADQYCITKMYGE